MAHDVSLVIPGRNCAATLGACLEAVAPLAAAGESRLAEIILVDDGSTDDTPRVAQRLAERMPRLRVLRGGGGGPGAARNFGWHVAKCPLVWFIDSDCVAEPEALDRLLRHMDEPGVGGAGGSYGNMRPDSLLASLIHEEIVERHRRMPTDVNFLGGFNVLYRRAALEQVGGFDERLFNGPGSPGAEDAELSFRVAAAGWSLRFEPGSIVRHYHPTSLRRYLRAQRHHGYWRVFLHLRYRDRAAGDDYSQWSDHVQPPLAMLTMAAAGLGLALGMALTTAPSLSIDERPAGWVRTGGLLVSGAAAAGVIALALAQAPMTRRMLGRTRAGRFAWFAALGMARAFARAIGMAQGMAAYPFVAASERARMRARGPARAGGEGDRA